MDFASNTDKTNVGKEQLSRLSIDLISNKCDFINIHKPDLTKTALCNCDPK